MAKQVKAIAEIISGEPVQFRPKVTRDHVAQEYWDRGDRSTAQDLCRNLKPKARRGVL